MENRLMGIAACGCGKNGRKYGVGTEQEVWSVAMDQKDVG